MSQARRTRRGPARPRRRDSGGLWMLVAGFVSGCVVTTLYYGVSGAVPTGIGDGLKDLAASAAATFERRTETAAPEPPAAPRPRAKLDFYTVLPEIERVMPDAPVEPLPERSADHPDPEPGVFYVLQAGAYARLEDADRLKARLALAGLEARIQKVTIESRGDFYRVRLGPFEDVRKLEDANQALAAQGITALRLRVTGTASG